MAAIFLKAEWRKLLMANYEIDEKLLHPFLPAHTEIDIWEGKCYISLVGFMFVNTKVKGLKIPFHINFEEVNLRFYVRRNDGDTWKRGVVFIKEIVPKPALTLVANSIYKENYETLPMHHKWEKLADKLSVEYNWKKGGRWHSISVTANNKLSEINRNSEEEFITEHYWGYTKINGNKTSEYEVKHPRWQVYQTIDHNIDTDFSLVYGVHFGFLNNCKPTSVFLAEGSEIEVMGGRKL